eukprot:g51735.t1
MAQLEQTLKVLLALFTVSLSQVSQGSTPVSQQPQQQSGYQNVPPGGSYGQVVARHSINPPYGTHLPFWDIGAGAFLNGTYVRLTPARQSRTGYCWNNVKQTMMTDWEATLEFQVTGRRNLGGDGFAFWFVEKPFTLGTVFGSNDFWNGLGIFFDTFNNDGRGESPVIIAVFNDGSQRYSHADDSVSQALATCSFPFRNLPDTAFAKITYQNEQLTLKLALHRDQQGNPSYVNCLTAPNLVLGVDKFFGMTAHTGDVADNHDIFSFNVVDLTPTQESQQRIIDARARYAEKIQYEHAQPDHQEMNQKDFQHEVLSLLNQIQEAQNMMELSQIEVEALLHQQAGQDSAAKGPPPPGTEDDEYYNQRNTRELPAGAGGAGAFPSDYAKTTQLASIQQAISEQLTLLRTLQNTVRTPPAAAPVQQMAPPVPDQRIQTVLDRLGQLELSHQSLNKLLQDSVRDLKAAHSRTQTALASSAGSNSSSGGLGMVFTALVCFSCVGVILLGIFMFKQQRERRVPPGTQNFFYQADGASLAMYNSSFSSTVLIGSPPTSDCVVFASKIVSIPVAAGGCSTKKYRRRWCCGFDRKPANKTLPPAPSPGLSEQRKQPNI